MHGINLDLLRPTTRAWMKQVEYLPQALLDNLLVKLHSLLPDTGIADKLLYCRHVDCRLPGCLLLGPESAQYAAGCRREYLPAYAVRSPGVLANAGELLLYCHCRVLFRYYWVLLLAGRASLSPTNQPGRSSPTSYVKFSVSGRLVAAGRSSEGSLCGGGLAGGGGVARRRVKIERAFYDTKSLRGR